MPYYASTERIKALKERHPVLARFGSVALLSAYCASWVILGPAVGLVMVIVFGVIGFFTPDYMMRSVELEQAYSLSLPFLVLALYRITQWDFWKAAWHFATFFGMTWAAYILIEGMARQ